MKKVHAGNARIKRDYFEYLKGPKRQSETSIDAAAKCLARFEEYTRHKDFKTFRKEQAIGFSNHLAEQRNERTNKPLSKATLLSTLAILKAFFTWLALQPGFKSRFSYLDADYFALSLKDTAIAKAVHEKPVPTLEQIRRVILSMPHETEIERRDRALMAFGIMTAARDGAIASLRIKDIDLAEGKVVQDARHVRTKFSKTFTTYFMPVGDDIQLIFAEWVNYLLSQKHWGLDDPLFPATQVAVGSSHRFEVVGIDKKCWSNGNRIRAIYRTAFAAAGLPYFNPHVFRNTLTREGMQRCKTPEEFKAWSQNIGHENVMTTFQSYGQVDSRRQAEIMRDLGKPQGDEDELIALGRAFREMMNTQKR